MNYLVAVVGPTGIGKSRLALRLARAFAGEIVSADSRQVYRFLDIGTAKPGPEELALVPHHLISIIGPDEDFSVAQYQEMAYKTIYQIQRRGKLPFLVGGSGLYVWSVLEGWKIPRVPPDQELRRSLEERAARTGRDELYRELVKVDSAAAKTISPQNVRRVIRALEVQKRADTLFSHLQLKEAPPFPALIIGLTTTRAELYRRIDLRVDDMVRRGLAEEVKRLVDMGYNSDLPAMSSIGYRQIGMYLRGELTLEAAIQQIKFETHRFVRHQYNWFRLEDKRIRWFDVQNQPEPEINALIANFIRGGNELYQDAGRRE